MFSTDYYHGDAVSEFQSAMFENIGFAPDGIIADGQLHRFKINGKLSGTYALHLNGRPAGFFQDFRQDIKVTWKAADTKGEVYSDTEKKAYKLRLIKDQEQRQKNILTLQSQAAIRARSIWNKSEKLHDNHPYLLKKQVQPNNAKLYSEAVVVPVFNKYKQLVSIQFINEDGNKRFLKDGELKGCFSVIGRTSPKPLAICEGWATACSVHEHRGHQTFIAFSANNLEQVARVLRDIFPSREIILFGDNDASQVGRKAAQAAAQAVGGTLSIPPDIDSDWNDYFTANPKGMNL